MAEQSFMKQALDLKVKTLLIVGSIAMVAWCVMKFFNAFGQFQQDLTEKRINSQIATVTVLNPAEVSEARTRVAMACSKDVLSGQLEDPTACAEAKKVLEVAIADNAKAQAGKSTIFDQRIQTKSWLEQSIQALFEKPAKYVPLGIFLLCFGAAGTTLAVRHRRFQRQRKSAANLI